MVKINGILSIAIATLYKLGFESKYTKLLTGVTLKNMLIL